MWVSAKKCISFYCDIRSTTNLFFETSLMAPRDTFELVILRLNFLPYIDPQYPRVSLTRKKHSPSGSITQVRDWFDRTMSREKAQLPPNSHIRYSEWRIMSGNASLFTVDGYRYDKILLILGEENIYWVFYQNMPMHRRIEGSGVLQLTYCGCCLNNQYLKIMESVKDCLAKARIC